MQYILFFLSLFSAYTVPMVMAAGSEGGTMVVMMSNALSTVSFVWYYNEGERKR